MLFKCISLYVVSDMVCNVDSFLCACEFIYGYCVCVCVCVCANANANYRSVYMCLFT